MRKLLIRTLRACGHDHPDEVLADLQDERRWRRSAGHRGFAIWAAWQLLTICLWSLLDRRVRRDRARIHPLLALRLAARNIVRQPGVPVAAALTLALGYGAAASIFGVYHGFGRPLPVPAGEDVVRLRVAEPDGVRMMLGRDQLDLLASVTDLFLSVGAFAGDSSIIAGDDLPPRRVTSARMTPEAFVALDVAPALGALPPADSGAVVLAHDLWVEAFEADPAVVGRVVRVGGRSVDVAAVMPPGFAFPYRQQLWLPMDRSDPDVAGELVARLVPGVSTAQASRMLEARWNASFADAEGETARTLVDGFTDARGEGGEELALLALLSLVIALLLVSCSNVSNLMLSRAVTRSRSLALHAAIGAGPGQVCLQMLTETLLIALGGAALGLVGASGAVRYIEGTLAPHWGYYWMRVQMEPAVAGFTLLLAAGTALVAGMLPAVRAARADVSEPLKQGSGGSDRRSTRMSWLLLTGQVAFSAAALVVATLMAMGLFRTREVEAGFPAAEVFVASVSLDTDRYQEASVRRGFRERLLDRLNDSDEVRSAALTVGLVGMHGQFGRLAVDGVEPDPEARPSRILSFGVSRDFFEVFDLTLEQGRLLLPGDTDAVVVSADFASQHLGSDALGRRIRLEGVAERWWRVVGVVSNVVIYDASLDRRLDWAYLPLEQLEPVGFYVTYRPAGEAAAATRVVTSAATALDPELPLSGAMGGGVGVPVTQVLAYVRRFMLTAGTLGAFGGLAAALVAAIGLYGIVAFEVGRRLPDFGLRMALGARRDQVLGLIVRHALARTAPGLVIGLLIAWAAGPYFGLFLFGVPGRNPLVLGGAALAYLLVAALAALVPGRRAATLDPAQVLRGE